LRVGNSPMMAMRFAAEFAKSTRTRLLPPEKLDELRSRRLRRLLAHAYEQVPYYHDLFRSIGAVPSVFEDPAKLKTFPALSRETLIQDQDRLRAVGVPAVYTRRTTGTTGVPLKIPWTEEYLAVFAALHIRQITVAGVMPWLRTASLWPPERTWRRTSYPGEPERPITISEELPFGRRLMRLLPNFFPIWSDILDPVHDAEALARIRPDFVISTPSRLVRVGRAAEAKGVVLRPKAVLLANETVTVRAKALLADLFDCPVLIGYGAAEFGPLGMECSYGRGIHLHEDYLVFEVMKDGERVGPGEEGELVLTTLHNRAMPLIRCRNGDILRLADSGVCECGSWLTRVAQIRGRAADGLVTSEGGRITPVDAAETVEESIGVRDYQLVQLRVDEFLLKVRRGTTIGRDSERRLEGALSRSIGVEVHLEVAENPDEDFVAKHRPVVCNVQA